MSENEIISQLSILYPDRTFSSISDCPLYHELSVLAKEKNMTVISYLVSLGFSKKGDLWTEQKILNRLHEIYPSSEYPTVMDIRERDPDFYKYLYKNAKANGITVMAFLDSHGFRKTGGEIHTNRLDQPWDKHTLKRLYYEYDVTFEQLATLFGCSKQTISIQINNKKDKRNTGGWEKALSAEEYFDTAEVIAKGESLSSDPLRTIMILIGRRNRDIRAVVYRTTETVSCVFDAEHVFYEAFSRRYARFYDADDSDVLAIIEEVWIKQGKMVSKDMRQLNSTASLLGMLKEYTEKRGIDIAEFLGKHGYVISDKDSITTEKLKNYLVPGTKNTVSISTKDTYYRTLSVAARRKGFSGIREYIESFGFNYESRRHSTSASFISKTVTSPEAIRRTIERIQPYVIPGTNIVQIDPSAPDYTYLVSTANARGFSSFKEMLEEYGFYYESKRGKRSSLSDADYDPDILKVITERYKVDDTYIYISAYDPFYYRLNNYAGIQGKSMDTFLSEHGYIRIHRIYDLPDDYIPYDYTDDLLQKVDGKWSEEKLRKILSKTADGNMVTLNYDSYLYSILKRRSVIAGISVPEYIETLGFKLHMTNGIIKTPEEEKKMEMETIQEELNILKNIQSEYKDVRSESVKVQRNQKLVKVLKSLYGGRCQLCDEQNTVPPIYGTNGERYCEVHHINPISSIRTDNDIHDIDSYKNTIVLCPYHHSYLHHQNGGGFVLKRNGGKLFLDNQHGDCIEIILNYHIE